MYFVEFSVISAVFNDGKYGDEEVPPEYKAKL